MAGKVHGKQIKDSSVQLTKWNLSGAQGTYTFGTGSKIGTYDLSFNPTDYITKQYADSLSAGLDPKEAVRLATTGTVSLSSAPALIDGVTASIGDRILVWQQANNTENGIYIYNGSGNPMTRSTDMDGSPASEVSTGNYAFVTEGSTNTGNGYIVVSSGTWSGVLTPLGTAPIVWTQFSGSGAFVWGDGLYNIGNTIHVDLLSSGGLTISSNKVALDPSIGGNGLAYSSGVLSVNTANGLTINGDNVEINSTAAGNGLSFTTGVFDVNASGGLTVSGDNVVIASSAAGNGLSLTSGVLNINVAKGVTISSDALFSDASTIQTTIYLDTLNIATGSSVQSALDSIDNYIGNLVSSSITSVVAGAGLTGGGASGSVTLNVTSGNAGIAVNADDITLTLGTGNDSSLSITGSGLVLNRTTLASNLDGSGISAASGVLNVNASGGLTVSGDNVVIASSAAGNALSLTSGVLDVNVAKGVTISGDALFADASTIQTTAYLPTIGSATNSSIQSVLSSIDTQLNTLTGNEMVNSMFSPTGTFLSSISTPVALNSGVTYSYASDGVAAVYVNGIYYRPGTATSSQFFFSSNGTTASEIIYTGYKLYSNVNAVTYDLDTTDEIVVEYMRKIG